MERCGAAAAASSSACNAGKIVSQGKQRRRSHVVGARNVSPGKKNMTVVPSQPEMTPEELAEYEKIVSQLEGKQPDFWEGEQWNWLGFVIQYLWVFGFVVSVRIFTFSSWLPSLSAFTSEEIDVVARTMALQFAR
jgi:hypothetical protein